MTHAGAWYFIYPHSMIRRTLRLALLNTLIRALVLAPAAAAMVQVPVRVQPVGGVVGTVGAAGGSGHAAGTSLGQSGAAPTLSAALHTELPPAGPAVVLRPEQAQVIRKTVAEDPKTKVMEPMLFDIIQQGDPAHMKKITDYLDKGSDRSREILFAMYNALSRTMTEAPLDREERVQAAMAWARQNSTFLRKLIRNQDVARNDKLRFKAALDLLNKDALVFEELAQQRMLQGRITEMERKYMPKPATAVRVPSRQTQGRARKAAPQAPEWKLHKPIPRDKRLNADAGKHEQSSSYKEVKAKVETTYFKLEKTRTRALLAWNNPGFSEAFRRRMVVEYHKQIEAAKDGFRYLRHMTNRIASVSLRRLFMGEARNHKIVWVPKNEHLHLVEEKGGYALVADFQTDITDDKALAFIKASIEDYWRGYFTFNGEQRHFRTFVRIRKVPTGAEFSKGALKLQGGSGRISHGGPDGVYLETDLDFATPAHEFGHVLGLADEYQEGYREEDRTAWSVQNQGSLMGSLGGSVLPDQFRLVYQLLRRHRLYTPPPARRPRVNRSLSPEGNPA